MAIQRYFNRNQKNHILAFVHFVAYLETMNEEYIVRNPEAAQKLKDAANLIDDAVADLFGNVDKNEIQKIYNDSKKMTLLLVYKSEAAKELSAHKEIDSNIIVDRNDLNSLSEAAIMECTRCRKYGADVLE